MGKEDHTNQESTTKGTPTILNNLRCFYTNADTLRNKMTEFKTRLKQYKPHIIGINEVKPKYSRYKQNESEFKINDIGEFDIFSENLDKDIGRGMLLYIHKHLEAKEVKMKTEFEESVFAKIRLNNNDNLLVGLIYRSDSGTAENNRKLRTLISEASSLGHSHILLMGDFNYPDINWNNWSTKGDNTESEEFLLLENLRDNYLFQHVDRPTRWRGTDTPNLLDLILTSEDDMIEEIHYESPLGKSDHCVLTFQFKCYAEIKERIKRVTCYDKANYEEISEEIKKVHWEHILGINDDINTVWEIFKNKIKIIEEVFVPHRETKISMFKKFNIPINNDTYQKIRKKCSLSRKYVSTKDPEVRREYNKVRNQVKREMRKMTKQFERKLAQEAKVNPKAIWHYINSKSKTRHGIGELHIDPRDDNSPTSDCDKTKAQILADFYSSVFTKEPDGDIPALERRVVLHQMGNLTTTAEDIEEVLLNLKVNKSPGLDGFHPLFMRKTAKAISKPLEIIFNKSLETGTIPDEWKLARISSIYKNKGSKKMAGNYRPISLTSVVCKTLETIIRNHIMGYMTENKFFSDKQFGFLPGRSSTLQLLKVLDIWTQALDEGWDIDIIYMDYMKAFDTVPHKRLHSKLISLQIY